MRYLSVCSGIEAATVAWHPLGWEPAAFSEIEAFPRAVLAHHYPEVPLHGDFTTISADDYGTIDLLVGGTPCQSFSIAGLRGGLADERGNLALEYLRLADRKRPRWLVWENVPGVLSIDGGRAFGAILGGMAELGYGFAYRVLDAQHFGVPQRRRRVFVVGHLGDWRRAAAVLFERHSLQGNPAPRREVGPSVAALTANSVGTCGADDNQGQAGHLIAGGMGRQDYETETLIAHALRAEGFDASEDGTGRGTPIVPVAIQERAVSENIAAGPQGKGWQEDCAFTLEARNKVQAVAFDLRGRKDGSQLEGPHDTANMRAASGGSSRSYISFTGGASECISLENCAHPVTGRNGDAGMIAFDTTQITSRENRANPKPCDPCHPLVAGMHPPAITGSAVRRLIPAECEALQGFPRGYTDVPYRGKPAADGPRYKALGNSMAVPCMRWIGERIAAVEALAQSLHNLGSQETDALRSVATTGDGHATAAGLNLSSGGCLPGGEAPFHAEPLAREAQ